MFYHITTKENAEIILKEGLKPMIGPNSQLIDEKEPAIYLCKRKDVPYWQIILQRFTILAIDEAAVKLEGDYYFKYNLYDEYIIKQAIKPEFIKKVYMPTNREKQNHDLCLDYLYNLSRFCEVCARWYDTHDPEDSENDGNPEWFEEIKFDSKLLTQVLPNLNYAAIDKSEIRAQLKSMGENGMYTFCGKFYDENKRLYQKLIDYPNDEITDYRKQIYDYIRTNLKGCLSVNTGGWCGC